MDLDLLAACEGLVANVYDKDDNILAADVDRWKYLFELTAAEAETEIREWRSSIGRESLGSEAWELIKDSLEGFDKESYEYALATQRLPTAPRSSRGEAGMNPKSRFLLKLEGPFVDVKAVQAIGNLESPPTKYHGADDGGEDVEFCIVNATVKKNIMDILLDLGGGFRPTFIRISEAEKNLSPICCHPTLGIDSTMPQYRLQNKTAAPAQNEYPVWYFFYGTLADQEVLGRVLQRDDISAADLQPAQVRGGRLTTWAGKYRAMVHADPETPPVAGSAFLVKTREEEDALRFYETERYAVVRCRIELIAGELGSSGGMDGLTFLFLG
ncbi:hypothetical protein F4818DRAFT_454649 [Hypoxylon cercidicola]|nr:hypothetical protein F4818DRAFT_454649 [Hypoxylon cercidicola]